MKEQAIARFDYPEELKEKPYQTGGQLISGRDRFNKKARSSPLRALV